jgi:hypothetical protein
MKRYVLFLVIATTGCATTYGPVGFGGGYSEMRLASDTYKVSFRGNGFTSSEQVQHNLFRRCAELTRSARFAYFLIIDEQDSARHQQVEIGSETATTSGSLQNNGYGQSSFQATTIVTHPAHFDVTKCTSTAVIKMFSPESHPQNALKADEIIRQYVAEDGH